MKRQKNGTWKLTDAEMNLFSVLAFEARERYESIGMKALAKNAHEIANQIYDVLDIAGYYNKEVHNRIGYGERLQAPQERTKQ